MKSFFGGFRRSLLNLDKMLLRHLAGDHLSASHAQGRTLEDHLCGTRQILAAWGQSTILQRAGLCHSLYSTEAFENRSVPLAERERVREAIGAEAEELVFLFCALRRAAFYRSVQRASSLSSSVSIPLHVRTGFEEAGQFVNGTQARCLLMLHLANFAEQAGAGRTQPTLWLEEFQRLVQTLEVKDPEAIPPALRELRSVNRYSERQALASYVQAIRVQNDSASATRLMEEVSQLIPAIPDPHIWLSWFWHREGDHGRGRLHARIAGKKLADLGTAWDKRLTFAEWRRLAKLGGKKHVSADMSEVLKELIVSAGMSEDSSYMVGASRTAQELNSQSDGRFEDYLLAVSAVKQRSVSGFYPGLRMDPFWPPEAFKLPLSLEARFREIRQEIEAIDSDTFCDEAENIERTGSWKVFMLLEAGRWNEQNLAKVPVLSQILKTATELRLAGGLVYLSRLSPGTVVSPHTGPTNMRLRLHFAIKVPDGDCALLVDGLKATWIEGKALVFNDFLRHEVWNQGTTERTILLVDLWHPDIKPRERAMLEAIHWMAQEHGQGLLQYWKQNEAVRNASGTSLPAPDVDNLVL